MNHLIDLSDTLITVGRKNYLFVGSHDGGRRAAIMYTSINICKRVNPFLYLQDVLRRVGKHLNSKTHELTPGNWKDLFA